MFFLYQVLVSLLLLISPIIIFLRIFNKKEDIRRFKEKFSVPTKKRIVGNLLWFHGSSVGEIMSIIPLLKSYEKKNSINQILVTSSTLSSSKILKRYNFKKTIHQFYPIDHFIFTNRFLKYWKPNLAIFIESEIWPCMFKNLKNQDIPLILLNARLTQKTFKRWMSIKNFTQSVFENISIAYPQNLETKYCLNKINIKKNKLIGNLKFTETPENNLDIINKKLKSKLKNKKIWIASSTHKSEEIFCAKTHIELKKRYKNLLTIIIPRHVDRAKKIEEELGKYNLKIHTHEPEKKINNKTDIYIVNTYGKTKSFYNICKNVFLGGSIINHGGQNPLEAARYGCNILHGPNISNFREIYHFLKKNNISIKVNNKNQIVNNLSKLFSKKINSPKIKQKLNLKGQKILMLTYKELQKFI